MSSVFLTETKHLLTQAMVNTFGDGYRAADAQTDFANLHVSVEFPNDPQAYPGLWVGFEPVGQLQTVGIDHREYQAIASGAQQGDFNYYRRWRFTGYGTYTVVALTSLQRDRLFDELVRIIAFGAQNSTTATFRQMIETNDFIAMNADFDELAMRGVSETQGTPWGTDEIIYETTVALECVGEFVSSSGSAVLVPLRAVDVFTSATSEPVPTGPVGETGAWQ